MSFGRRLMTMAAALLLVAVAALPLLAQARHEAPGPAAQAVLSMAGQDHPAGHRDADDLVHHAQSHAQGVMPAAAGSPGAGVLSVAQSFTRADEAFRAGGDGQGPFEPPRA